MRPANEPTETQSDHSSRIRSIVDMVAYCVLDGTGNLAHRVDSLPSAIHSLAIQVLNAAFGLSLISLSEHLPSVN